MKRLAIILAAVAAMFAFSSCEKTVEDQIVGTWDAKTAEMTIQGIKMEIDLDEMDMALSFTFNSDKTGSMKMTAEGDTETTYFDYVVNGGTLTMIDDLGDTVNLPITISGKNMTIVFDEELLDSDGKMTFHLEKR